jgi:hypothetical protein
MSDAADRFKEINDILATVPSRTPPHPTAPPRHVLTLSSSTPLCRAAAAAEDQVLAAQPSGGGGGSAGGLTLVYVVCCVVCVLASDLLRALNRDLGHPVNTYSITAKYCVKAVLAHSLEMGACSSLCGAGFFCF